MLMHEKTYLIPILFPYAPKTRFSLRGPDIKIERKATIRNRYNYPTRPIRDIKEKETQTRTNGNITSRKPNGQLLSHKWPNGYPKQKDVSDTHIQRRTITKINHDRRTALERSVKSTVDSRYLEFQGTL